MLVQERLNKLRELMKQHDMDAYIIVTDDYRIKHICGRTEDILSRRKNNCTTVQLL